MIVRRPLAVLAPTTLAFAAAVLAGPAAHAAPSSAPSSSAVPAATASSACAVKGGTLTWGVKESFRSYISGSIAQGGWEAADGATYATPVFTFTGATGEIDRATGAGRVSFAGSVHFTGHGGILDLTIAAPTLQIAAGGATTLLLDVRSNDTSGNPAVDAKQAEVGTVSTPLSADAAAGALKVADAPVVLSAAGAPAFGGFYAEGEELDPLTADVQLECAPASPTAAPATATPTATPAVAASPEAAAADAAGAPWAPIAIGAGAVAAAGAVVATIAVRRRKH